MSAPKLFSIKILLQTFAFFSLVYFSSCIKNDFQPSSSGKEITSFLLKKADGSAFDTSGIKVNITGDTIKVTVPSATNLNGLIPNIVITGVSVSPATNIAQDFSKPVTYTVTAADGSTKNYIVIVNISGPANMVFVGSSDNNFYALNALTGKLIWKFTGGGWFSYASPTMYNGIVYAGCTDNNLYALDALTGNLIWKFTTGGSIEASLTVADGVTYVGSDDDNMYALDAATGNLIWKYTTGANVSSSPAVLNGVVYFGSSDNNIYALDIQNGNLKWKFSAQEMINQSGVSISNGVAFVGSRDGNLYAIDAVTGSLKWKYYTGGISLEQSSPTVSNGVVYIGGWYNVPFSSLRGSVYAINETSGKLVWQSLDSLGFSCSPYIANNVLYISADDGNFYALNASTGSIIWSKYILPNGAGAAVTNGMVYIGGGGTHYIYAYDEATGYEVWRFSVGQNGLSTSSPCVIGANGSVYNPGDSGQEF